MFGFYFCYHHQVSNNNNSYHYNISIESTRDVTFWPYCKFAWPISVMGVNTALAFKHFQNGGGVKPTLDLGGGAFINTVHVKQYFNRYCWCC